MKAKGVICIQECSKEAVEEHVLFSFCQRPLVANWSLGEGFNKSTAGSYLATHEFQTAISSASGSESAIEACRRLIGEDVIIKPTAPCYVAKRRSGAGSHPKANGETKLEVYRRIRLTRTFHNIVLQLPVPTAVCNRSLGEDLSKPNMQANRSVQIGAQLSVAEHQNPREMKQKSKVDLN
jgi:hypothetical protein